MRKRAILLLFVVSGTAHAQGFLENLGNSLGSSLSSGLGNLFRQKSALEKPPEKLPDALAANPAFDAPTPLVRSITMKPRSSLNWPFGTSDLERIQPGTRYTRSSYSAVSVYKEAA